MVNYIPDGFHTVSPHIVVSDAAAAVKFYEKAFGAEGSVCMPGPDGEGVMHAELRIGNSMIMIGCASKEHGCLDPKEIGGSPVTLHLYVPNVDAAFQRAVAAGAKATMPVTDMFWGDRYGQVEDPFGHKWSLATHTADLTPEQIQTGFAEWMKSQGGGCCEGH